MAAAQSSVSTSDSSAISPQRCPHLYLQLHITFNIKADMLWLNCIQIKQGIELSLTTSRVRTIPDSIPAR